jgi:hypothetical protein
MDAALQQFDKNIKEEILRRLQEEESATMSRAEIEEIGLKAGLPKLRAAGEFMRLAGEAWAGYIHPATGAPFWLGRPPKELLPRWVAVDFHRGWFQNKGMLSRSPLGKINPIELGASRITNDTPLV